MGSAENRSEQISPKKSSFEKVGECLYRYTSNGMYYARVEKEGKEFRRSLKTTDRALAKRKLADFQREIGRTLPGANRTTVAQLADMYLATQQNLEKSTREDKGRIVRRIKDSWPGGSSQSLDKVRPSHVEGWLSAQGGGAECEQPQQLHRGRACRLRLGRAGSPFGRLAGRRPHLSQAQEAHP